MNSASMWERYKQHLVVHPSIGLRLDISRMKFGPRFFEELREPAQQAFAAMAELERGAIANPDEKRQVGHYWLRASHLAPTAAMREEIDSTAARIKAFAADVHAGKIKPAQADKYEHVLHVGIGGSALGPQLINHALHSHTDPMRIHFLDNTDPDGIDRTLAGLGPEGLKRALVLVVSKSGGTKETRNGMLEVRQACERAGLSFAKQAVAITQMGSALSKLAEAEGWVAQFPMWEWVGGRTSETSAVGLLPAALQGFDIDALLAGARDCDAITRTPDMRTNPAMVLALMWLHARSAGIAKDMVVVPYKDRLELLTRYLQQLIMESVGKNRNLGGHVVQEGLAVYGNKGSTDQHAYIQQLREGTNNFFAMFIEVLRDRDAASLEVEPGVTSGDYLLGFLLGTRQALFEGDRESITITVDTVDARTMGVLIALFERAVGFYASLVGINAYHQPGVEAGKRAANHIIQLQTRAVQYLESHAGAWTAEQIASGMGAEDDTELVFKVLEHLAANADRKIKRIEGPTSFAATFSKLP